MRRLIRACVVCKLHKGPFGALRITWWQAQIIKPQRKKKIPSHICAKRKLKSACASTLCSGSSYLCILSYPKCAQWKFRFDCGECADWSGFSLGANVRRYVYWTLQFNYIWTLIWENVFLGLCAQRTRKSNCTSVYSDMSHRLALNG